MNQTCAVELTEKICAVDQMSKKMKWTNYAQLTKCLDIQNGQSLEVDQMCAVGQSFVVTKELR